jgi:hypothetical protein
MQTDHEQPGFTRRQRTNLRLTSVTQRRNGVATLSYASA